MGQNRNETAGVNSNPSHSEQTESTAGEGVNASGGSSSPLATPETPNPPTTLIPNTATCTAAASSTTDPSPSRLQLTQWNEVRHWTTPLPAATEGSVVECQLRLRSTRVSSLTRLSLTTSAQSFRILLLSGD
jgi:hypothetical protein